MADVDPRFDPRFQRGYDPEVHGADHDAASGTPADVPEPPIRVATDAPRDSGSAAPSPDPDHAPDHAESVPSPLPRVAADDAEGDETVSDPDRSPAPRPRVILLVLAIVLILSAAALFMTGLMAATVYYDAPTEWETLVMLARGYAVSPLLLGGIVAVLGWLLTAPGRARDE